MIKRIVMLIILKLGKRKIRTCQTFAGISYPFPNFIYY